MRSAMRQNQSVAFRSAKGDTLLFAIDPFCQYRLLYRESTTFQRGSDAMMKTLSRHLRRLIHGTQLPRHPELPRSSVLDLYVDGVPSPAKVAALFQDQWLSKL